MLFSATLFSNNEYFKDDGDKEDAMNDVAINVRRCDERILYKNVSVVYVISIKRRFHARERTRINHHHGRRILNAAVKKKKLFHESANSKKRGGFEEEQEEEQEASVGV